MVVHDNPSSQIHEQLRTAVLAMRPADVPDADRYFKVFAVTEEDAAGSLLGGAYVYIHPGWAYVDLIWVDESHRGRGLGKKLMEQAEGEAVKRGCHSAYVWTQDFEAPGFYEKLGYHRFVVMEDFIPGHQRIGFMKRLAA